MRSVITHFKNEAYLLPWWLAHHKKLFDFGIMINHGSTDDSFDIIRTHVPHWRVVNSTLTSFNAFMTDFEVMQYERGLPGWKIALNMTEFLLPRVSLSEVESALTQCGLDGISCSGFTLVDKQPNAELSYEKPLLQQLHWGFNDNDKHPSILQAIHDMAYPARNRFYHKHEVGMYYPGRHMSYHQDSKRRTPDLMVFHLSFAPWNDDFLRRKLAIKDTLDPGDIKRNWALQHQRDRHEWHHRYQIALQYAIDLRDDEPIRRAIGIL